MQRSDPAAKAAAFRRFFADANTQEQVEELKTSAVQGVIDASDDTTEKRACAYLRAVYNMEQMFIEKNVTSGWTVDRHNEE